MDNRFLTAFIAPRKFEMCGLKLRPFSPRIYINLCAIESPFVTQGKEPTPEDVMLFLKFCSGKYESITEIKKFSFWERIAISKMYGDLEAFSNTLFNIKTYLEEYTAMPRVIEMGNKKNVVLKDKRTAPELMMLVSILISKCGFSEDEAWDMSIGKAVWYTTCYAVTEGAEIRFISTEEEERAEQDRANIIKHAEEMANRLRKAMDNGVIKRRNIKISK